MCVTIQTDLLKTTCSLHAVFMQHPKVLPADAGPVVLLIACIVLQGVPLWYSRPCLLCSRCLLLMPGGSWALAWQSMENMHQLR